MHGDYGHSKLLLLLHHKEHFLISITNQYWSIYILKDLLQGRGKLTESFRVNSNLEGKATERQQVWNATVCHSKFKKCS